MKYIILPLLLLINGCGTLLGHGLKRPGTCTPPYIGLSVDFSEFRACHKDPWLIIGGLIDAPFSFVADTILLPYDLTKRYMFPECRIKELTIFTARCPIMKGTRLTEDLFQSRSVFKEELVWDPVQNLDEIENCRSRIYLDRYSTLHRDDLVAIEP